MPQRYAERFSTVMWKPNYPGLHVPIDLESNDEILAKFRALGRNKRRPPPDEKSPRRTMASKRNTSTFPQLGKSSPKKPRLAPLPGFTAKIPGPIGPDTQPRKTRKRKRKRSEVLSPMGEKFAPTRMCQPTPDETQPTEPAEPPTVDTRPEMFLEDEQLNPAWYACLWMWLLQSICRQSAAENGKEVRP